VLEQLRLGVYAVPGQVERLGEEQLQQPVVPQHLERDPAPLVREPHASVRGVRNEPELREPLHHRGRSARRHPHPLGKLVVADRLVRAALERIDRLRVILDHSGETGKFY
jgi:hypothetical protein